MDILLLILDVNFVDIHVKVVLLIFIIIGIIILKYFGKSLF
jgi:hypothetical protein